MTPTITTQGARSSGSGMATLLGGIESYVTNATES